MQFYALEDHRPILAKEAIRQKNYRCPECLGIVRLRGGEQRQNHFYHLHRSPSCRQSQKSLPHLQTQLFVQSQFSGAVLEKSFTQIGRIGDVCWEEGKLIFEIQCSPISLQEVRERNRDYEKLGYRVVWLLHDRRFNRFRVSPAEKFLRGQTTFFANIDAAGRGIIYDQQELFRGLRRVRRGPKLRIDVTQPLHVADPFEEKRLPWRERVKQGYLRFFRSLLEAVAQ